MPVHLQPAYYGRVRTAKTMAVTETIAKEVVSLPIYPGLSSDDVRTVVNTINNYI
jgi:dTDP-4-amino-4,6-dideoxygalactose transaminase